MATTFMDKLYADAYRAGVQKDTQQSREWFRKKLQKVKTVNRRQLLKDDNYTARGRIGLPGRMFMYFYDPKTKKDLPYYDRFPLIFMVEKAKGGFYGLNLHYLPPRQRAIFFDRLLSLSNNKKYDETTRLRMQYRILKASSRLEMYKPCFKHYLAEHVRSQIVEIPASEWEAVLFLPTEYFMKNAKSTVWAKTRKMI